MNKSIVILTQKDPIFNLKVVYSLLNNLTYENAFIIYGRQALGLKDIIINAFIFGFFQCVKYIICNLFIEKQINKDFPKIQIIHVTNGDIAELINLKLKKKNIYGISVSFPFKISDKTLSLFNGKLINFHNSFLPFYRGLSPIYHQLKDSVCNFSFTIHEVTKAYDRGNIIYQASITKSYGKGFHCSEILTELCKLQTHIISIEKDKIFNKFYYLPEDDLGSYYSKPSVIESFKFWISRNLNLN